MDHSISPREVKRNEWTGISSCQFEETSAARNRDLNGERFISWGVLDKSSTLSSNIAVERLRRAS